MKKITALFLSLLMLLSLCACGSVNRQAKSAPAAYESSFYAESPIAQEAAASYDMAGLSSANTAAARGGAEKEVPAESAPEERADKILYSADVTVETTDFDAALGQVAELVERFGGWIESSSINGSNKRDGTISDPIVILPVSPGIDRQAVDAVMDMPRWKPAVVSGQPVRSRVSIPVMFKLKEE